MLYNDDARSTTQFKCESARSPVVSMIHEVQYSQSGCGSRDASVQAVHRWLRLFSRGFQRCDRLTPSG
jgi:hypothetical protein